MPSAPKAQMFMKNNKIHWKMTDIGWTLWLLWSHVYVELKKSHTVPTACKFILSAALSSITAPPSRAVVKHFHIKLTPIRPQTSFDKIIPQGRASGKNF